MKKRILTAAFLLCSIITFSQEVKLKKEKVLCDDKEIMTFDVERWGTHQIHLYSLDSKEEQINILKRDNETSGYFDDDFVQIKFLTLGKTLELKMNKPWSTLIEWLIKNKALGTDGKLNEEKVDLLIKNYDENITNRTVR